jgi:outer membrane protein TolC
MNYKTLFLLLITSWVSAQNAAVLTYNEYLGYVKKFHPLVKSANLKVNSAQANLMMARGGFDPKIEIDFDQKQFKDKEYYSILNSSFKIPTWYGIEIKAGFDNSEGIFVNPQNTMPNQGLTSLGVNVPVGQGLLINQRMADLRKSKIQLQLSEAERKLQATEVLYEASVAYFNWKRAYQEVKLYENYLQNAIIRLNGTSQLIQNGDKPAIDSVEASITVKNRQLNIEESRLKLIKAKLDLATFLWLEDNIPLELQDTIIPEENLDQTIGETLQTNDLMLTNPSLENHPKIDALESKIGILEVERKLKNNQLLPKIDLGYHYLSESNAFSNTDFKNYKVGVNFSFPIFLRKERGSLKMTQFKIQDTKYELDLQKLQLTNKISAQQAEIDALQKQRELISNLVVDFSTMLQSEEKLFSFGESSLFIINSRENNLVLAQLSKLNIENRYFTSNAELFKIIANPD